MGDSMDDVRASLVMNPNFCRIRYNKKEEMGRKNGFIEKEANGQVIFERGEQNLEDNNGNLNKREIRTNCKQARCRNGSSHQRDTKVLDLLKGNVKNVNCMRCVPSVDTIRNSFKDQTKQEAVSVRKSVQTEKASTYDEDMIRDSKETSSDGLSKESSSSDGNSSSSGVCLDGTLDLDRTEAMPFELRLNESSSGDLELSPSQYASLLDEHPIRIIQTCTHQSPTKTTMVKNNPCTSLLICTFILLPTAFFYFLSILYIFQPEPFYTTIMKTLKLKDQTKPVSPMPASISALFEYLNNVLDDIFDYMYEVLQDIASDFIGSL